VSDPVMRRYHLMAFKIYGEDMAFARGDIEQQWDKVLS